MQKKGQPPAGKWRAGGISVTKWENVGGASYVVNRSYKDKKTNEWKDTSTFYPEQLKECVTLLQKVIAEEKL